MVGKSKIPDKITGEPRLAKYSDVPTDSEKWVFDLSYMPIPFDLMHLKMAEHSRVKAGWWNGLVWKGTRLKADDTVIAWKRNHDFD